MTGDAPRADGVEEDALAAERIARPPLDVVEDGAEHAERVGVVGDEHVL
jgi:hypothetical protein